MGRGWGGKEKGRKGFANTRDASSFGGGGGGGEEGIIFIFWLHGVGASCSLTHGEWRRKECLACRGVCGVENEKETKPKDLYSRWARLWAGLCGKEFGT